MDAVVGRPRADPAAVIGVRRQHLLSRAAHARLLGEPPGQRAAGGAGDLDHRQPGPRDEPRGAAGHGALRRRRVPPGVPPRYRDRRRRAVRRDLRVLPAALPAAGSVPSRDDPVDPVRPGVAPRVPGVGPAPRCGADRDLLHPAGSFERPRRRVSAARDARRRRVPARPPRPEGVSGEDGGSGCCRGAARSRCARIVAVPRGAAGDGPQAVARGLVGAVGELSGLVIARRHVSAVARAVVADQRRDRTASVSRRAADCAGGGSASER